MNLMLKEMGFTIQFKKNFIIHVTKINRNLIENLVYISLSGIVNSWLYLTDDDNVFF